MTSMGMSSCSMGTASAVRYPNVVAVGSIYSRSRVMSSTCTATRLSIDRPDTDPRLGGSGNNRSRVSSLSGMTLCCATKCISRPSNRMTRLLTASHNRVALAAIALNTGWISVFEFEMTRNISEVAVCCSNASASSRVRLLICSCNSAPERLPPRFALVVLPRFGRDGILPGRFLPAYLERLDGPLGPPLGPIPYHIAKLIVHHSKFAHGMAEMGHPRRFARPPGMSAVARRLQSISATPSNLTR